MLHFLFENQFKTTWFLCSQEGSTSGGQYESGQGKIDEISYNNKLVPAVQYPSEIDNLIRWHPRAPQEAVQ